MKELEESGVIRRYGAILDPVALGLGVTVLAEVELDDHHPDTVRAFDAEIGAREEVLEAFRVSGNCDYSLKIVAASLESYSALQNELLQLNGVHRINTMFVMGAVKTDSPYPLNHL